MKPDTLIHNPCAKPVVSSVVVACNAARAWAVVGDFAGFDKFIPALSRIDMTGTGAGCLRKKFFNDGNLVVEQLNSRDEQAMQMTWTTIYNTLGVARLWAAMSVEASGEGCSRVTWTIIAEPVDAGARGFEQFVQAFADNALENVQGMFAQP